MKKDVYELTTSDIELGIWERKFRGTIDIDENLSLEKERRFAAEKLDLSPKYTRCFEHGERVALRGHYTKEALKRLREEEDRCLCKEELEAKYE